MHPSQIGPYVIDRKIGAGGMGNVYLGTHRETGLTAAVKVLPASLARESGFIERFTREIQALRKLQSQYIVELFDDGSTPDGAWYFAMEYVDGETLTNLISRRKKIPWQEVIDYTLQIAAALKAAHDAGVVHRDIKPSNLMVATDGTVKLTDFGVAHIFATTRLTRTGGVVGTAEYMSPEQARGQRATKRSDLYSLGAVMYAMLTGRPAFGGKNANEVLHKQQFAQLEKPRHYVPEIPRLFEELVCKLMEKKPEHRIPDAIVLSRKLEQVRARIDFKEKQQQLPISQQQPTAVDQSSMVDHRGDDAVPLNNPNYHGPGPATIVRNLIRQEAASQLDKSAIGRFFDNTIVLVGSFAFVVGLGFYLTQNATPSDAERFAEAESIMRADAGPAWFRARDTFRDMLQMDAFPDERTVIERNIRKIDHYEFCRSLELAVPSVGSHDLEIQRLIQRAFTRFASGEIVEAREELAAVLNLVNNSLEDEYLARFIAQTLKDWEADTSLNGRKLVVQQIIADAKNEIGKIGSNQVVTDKLTAAISLYEDDLAVSDLIQECRKLLHEISNHRSQPFESLTDAEPTSTD